LRNEDSNQWEVVEFPAVIDHTNEDGSIEQKSLWPEFWPLEQLLEKKASLDPRYWAAQYLQSPTSEEGALIKREWWRVWEKEDAPECSFTIMALDAAQEQHNRANYNSLTYWGVWFNEEEKGYHIILLDSIRQRMEFPELKELVLEEYTNNQPDSFIVEKKSNGVALYQEMRRMGVPLSEFTPGKGNDKISRVNSVADLFRSGVVWIPDRRWAWEMVEECAEFPSGEYDDQVDSMTLALMRFRQGGYIRLDSDEPEEPRYFRSKRNQGYYQVL
jgi:predicted phage terminase large subunit-like protein